LSKAVIYLEDLVQLKWSNISDEDNLETLKTAVYLMINASEEMKSLFGKASKQLSSLWRENDDRDIAQIELSCRIEAELADARKAN